MRTARWWAGFAVLAIGAGPAHGDGENWTRMDSLIAVGVWDTECSGDKQPSFRCAFEVEVRGNPEGLGDSLFLRPKRRLEPPGPIVFTLKKADRFSGMYPTGGVSRNLVALWTGGSAFHVSVIHRDNAGRFAEVLDTGARALPELVTCSDDEPVIVLSTSKWSVRNDEHVSELNSSAIYRWDKTRYVAESVPWADRFTNVCRKGSPGTSGRLPSSG